MTTRAAATHTATHTAPYSPATRSWGIATLILTVIYLLVVGASLYQLPDSPISTTGRATLLTVLTIAQFAVAIAFLDGSIGIVKNRGWARWTLVGASAVALPVIAVGAILQMLLRGDPAYLKAVTDQIAKKAPQMASMPPEAMQQAVNLQMTIIFFSGIFLALVQVVYCILLLRHMAGSGASLEISESAGR